MRRRRQLCGQIAPDLGYSLSNFIEQKFRNFRRLAMNTFQRRMMWAAAAVMLTCGAAGAQSQGPITLACTPSNGGAATTVNVASYEMELSATGTVVKQATGPSLGKMKYVSLKFHTALVNFETFQKLSANGTVFSHCVLTTPKPQATYEFSLGQVMVSAVTLSGGAGVADGTQVLVELSFATLDEKTTTGARAGGAGH
jgi:hypothetical protein